MAKNEKPKWLNSKKLLEEAGTSLQKKAEITKQQPKLKTPEFKNIVSYICDSCHSQFTSGQIEPQIRRAARTGKSHVECPGCGAILREQRVAQVKDLSPVIHRAQHLDIANRAPNNSRVPNMWIDKAIYGRLVQKISEYVKKVGIIAPQLRFQRGIRSSKFPGEPHSAKGAEFSIEFIDYNNTHNRILVQAGLTPKGDFIYPKTFRTLSGNEYPLTKEAIENLTRGKIFDQVMPDMRIPPLHYRPADPTRFREISANLKEKIHKTAQTMPGGVPIPGAPIDESQLDIQIQELGITNPTDAEQIKGIMRKYIDPTDPEAFAPGMSQFQSGQNFTAGLGLGIAENKLNLRKLAKVVKALQDRYWQAVIAAANNGLTYDEATTEVFTQTGVPLNERVWTQATQYLEVEAEQAPMAIEAALANQLVTQAEEKISQKFHKTAEDIKNEFDFSRLSTNEIESFVNTFVTTYNQSLETGEGPVNAQRIAHVAAGKELHANRVKNALRDKNTLVPFTETDPDYSLAEQTKQSEPRFDHPGGAPKKYHEMDGGISDEKDRNYSDMFGRGDSQHFASIKEAKVVQEDGEWIVKSEAGKTLGKHDTEDAAQKQLRAIEINKHKKGSIEKTAAYIVTPAGQQAITALQQGMPTGTDTDPQALLGVLSYFGEVPHATTDLLVEVASRVNIDEGMLRTAFAQALQDGLLAIAPTPEEEGIGDTYEQPLLEASEDKIVKKGESTGVDLEPDQVGQNPINYSRYKGMVQDLIRAGNIPPTKVDMHKLKDSKYSLQELKDLVQTFKVDSKNVMYPTSHATSQSDIQKLAEQKLSDLIKEMPVEKQVETPTPETSAEGEIPGAEISPLTPTQRNDVGEKMQEVNPVEKDNISGGLADNAPAAAFDVEQLIRGIEIEMEHTSDSALAEEIAKDHLMENPNYYSDLRVMENATSPRNVKDLQSTLINATKQHLRSKQGFEINDEQGRTIAGQLGIRYDGLQERVPPKTSMYTFTDPITGSTFFAEDLQNATQLLHGTREAFGNKNRAAQMKKAQGEEELPPGTILGPTGEKVVTPGEEGVSPLRLAPPQFLSRKAPGIEEGEAVEAHPREEELVNTLVANKAAIDGIQQRVGILQQELQTKIAPLQQELGALGQQQMKATRALTMLMQQLGHALIRVDNQIGQYLEQPQKIKLTTPEKLKLLLGKFGDDATTVLAEAEKNINEIERIVGKYKQWPTRQAADITTEEQYLAALYQDTYNALSDLVDNAVNLNIALAA